MSAIGVLGVLALPPAAIGGNRKLPVKIRLEQRHQAELIASGALPVKLRLGRRARVRVSVALRPRKGRRIALGSVRRVRLRGGRWRSFEVPLKRGARRALAGCGGGRLALTVREQASGRRRSIGPRLQLDPPDCTRFFEADAVWNTPLDPDAPLDPDSAEVTAELLGKVEAGFRSSLPPTINTTSYTPPVYTVSAGQRRTRVRLDRPPGYAPDLERAFASVPLPAGAAPAGGADAELVVWQPATDTLWEFWRLRREADGWHADWGGRMRNVSANRGFFGAPHANWGATATSLALAGGLITARDVANGEIDHALALGIPDARAGQFSLPAQRTDGVSTCLHAVPQGARFRLDPALDVRSLGLAPPVAALARAAQRYGIIVREQSAAVAFYAQNPRSLPRDPYPAFFGGRAPWDLLATFPWSRLQLVHMQLRGQRPARRRVQDVLSGCADSG